MDLQTSAFQPEAEVLVVENVIPLCEMAKGLEEAGEFELAEETSALWEGVPNRPNPAGFSEYEKVNFY